MVNGEQKTVKGFGLRSRLFGTKVRRIASSGGLLLTAAVLVFSVLTVLYPSHAKAAISYVGERYAANLSAATFSPSSNTTAGDFLVLIYGSSAGNAQVTSVSDTKGNTWNIDVSLSSGSGASKIGFTIASAYLSSALTTSDTITTNAASAYGRAMLEEFSGVSITSWTDKTASNSGTGTALSSGTTATTTAANELVVSGWALTSNTGTFTKDSGSTYFTTSYVSTGGGNQGTLGAQYRTVSSTGAQSDTGTSSAADPYSGGIVTFKANPTNIYYMGERYAGTPSSSSFSPSTNTTAGDFLVMLITHHSTNTLSSVSDSQSNTWTVDVSVTVGSGAGATYFAIASTYLTNALATSDTITLSGIPDTYPTQLEEFSGINSASWTDQTTTNTGTSTSLASGTTGTTSQADELAVGGWGIGTTATFTQGGSYSPFTSNEVQDSTDSNTTAGEFQLISSTGTQSASGTSSASANWAGGIATYKEDSSTVHVIQSKSAGGTGTAPTATFGFSPTQNDLLVASVFTSVNSTITMTSGGWNALTSVASGAGVSARSLRMFYKIAGAGESSTVTASTSSADWVITLAEYSGIDTSSTLNVENAQSSASGTTQTTPSVTPTGSGGILVVGSSGFRSQGTSSNETVNSSTTGVTERQDVNAGASTSASGSLYDKTFTSFSGSYTGSATSSVSIEGAAGIAIFNVASTSNSPPAAPTLSTPSDTATGVSLTPQFQLSTTDGDSDYVDYEIQVCSNSSCSSVVYTACEVSGLPNTCDATSQTGWSGQDANSGLAYSTTSSSGTTATYNYQGSALSAGTQYWWRAYAIDPGGSNTASSASSIWSFTTNYVPNTSALSVPPNGAAVVKTPPVFRLSTTDSNGDYLDYEIQICSDSSCSSVIRTICQVSDAANSCTGDQTGWTSQSQNLGAAYSSGQTAVYDYQFSDLTSNTQYWWRAYAIDPGGSDTWSSASAIHSFTTQDLSSSSSHNICVGNC